jgi:hypothetical protein
VSLDRVGARANGDRRQYRRHGEAARASGWVTPRQCWTSLGLGSHGADSAPQAQSRAKAPPKTLHVLTRFGAQPRLRACELDFTVRGLLTQTILRAGAIRGYLEGAMTLPGVRSPTLTFGRGDPPPASPCQ